MSKPQIKETSFIPILQNFDYAGRPLGYVDTADGNIVLKLNDKEKITVDDVNAGRAVFAPSYMIIEEKDGIVTKISVESFSLLKQRG